MEILSNGTPPTDASEGHVPSENEQALPPISTVRDRFPVQSPQIKTLDWDSI